MSSKLNHEGVLLLEQPFVRIPYENYRKVFRTSQKYIEREMGALQSSTNDLAQQAKHGIEPSDMETAIDAMIAKVEGLKQKLNQLNETSGQPTISVMRNRLDHVGIVESMQSHDTPEFEEWAATRMDRWIVDWALRTGKTNTAKHIAHSRHIEEFVDIDLFSEVHRIETALRNHSCTEALSWCSENKNALRKIKCTLEFELRLQEFIELARQRKLKEAIAYSRKHLAPWKETQSAQIVHSSALLVTSPTTTCKPYKSLYSPARWVHLIKSFRSAMFSLNVLPPTPLLHLALYAGLASLKLPACFTHSQKNPDCPICDAEGLGVLAKEVPFSHHFNSTIVCQLSGKIMDENNGPMAFPNEGYVYSRDALQDMADKNNGIVTCVRSGKTCRMSDLKKLYIS